MLHFAAKKVNKNTINNNNFENNNNNNNNRGVTMDCQGNGEAGRFPVMPGPVWFVSATLFTLMDSIPMQMVFVQVWMILPTTVGHNVTQPHREGLTVVS